MLSSQSHDSDDEEKKEREKKERIEASLREREKEVQRTLSSSLRERDKEREQHKRDEAEQHFKALLADSVSTAANPPFKINSANLFSFFRTISCGNIQLI